MEMVEESQDYQLSRLKQAQAQKEANLEFFKEFHPSIYERFSSFKLDKYKVSLNTDIDQLDVLLNGTSIYNDRPIAEAKEIINDFERKYSPGMPLKTIDPPFNTYIHPRFFHARCNELIKSSPLKAHDYLHYTIPEFYPLMIFNGVGAGYHIEIFTEKHAILNCAVVEHDAELFACSLYTVDWEKICQPFLDHKERNIHFIIGPFSEEQQMVSYVQLYVAARCPLYPLTTLFINHNNDPIYQRLTEKVNKDTNAFVSTWGYYDDEINQINNCLHNLHLGIPIIKPNHYTLLDLPIFIIGAGPSLDDKIDLIKSYKGKALIVSCGTAIHSLYNNGIKPDIQFELESDQVTVTSLDELGDPDWIRSIPMMGPSQLAPRLYQLADKKVVFFKGESVTSMLFGDKDSSVTRATPTCTNGAVGVFSHWGFKNIFLFGLDFGYRDTSKHHASGSVYYKSKDPAFVADANVAPEAKIDIKAVGGGTIKTKPLLYTAMRSVEIIARQYKKHCTFYNCSNGADMEFTTWIPDNNLPIKSEDINPKLVETFLQLQYENDHVYNIEDINKKLDILSHNMNELASYIRDEINQIKPTIFSLTKTISHLSTFLEQKLRPEAQAFYFFLRGSIWHLFYIGYSHALCLKDDAKLYEWIENWKVKTIATLMDMIQHYESIVYKDFDFKTDPWMLRSASDPE